MITSKKCKKISLRFCAFIVGAAFLTNSISSVPVLHAAEPAKPSIIITPELKQITIPKNLADIQERFQGKGSAFVAIIQDAHSVPDAQTTIRKTIEYFQKHYGVKKIGLEGVSGKLDTQFLRSYPDKKKLAGVLKQLHQQSELAGGTAAALLNDKADFTGLENWELYEKGMGEYLTALRQKDQMQVLLQNWESGLNARKKTAYSKKLQDFDAVINAFDSGQNQFTEALEKASKIKMPEANTSLGLLLKEINLSRKDQTALEAQIRQQAESVKKQLSEKTALTLFEERFQAFKTGALDSLQFAEFLTAFAHKNKARVHFSAALSRRLDLARKLHQVQGSRLFEELHTFLYQVQDSLIENDAQRQLAEETRQWQLYKHLLQLDLTFSDWAKLKTDSDSASIHETALRSQAGIYFQFYETAIQRDSAFLENLQKSYSRGKIDEPAIMVTGGFHAQGLTSLLKEQGIPYLLLTPVIRHLPENPPYEAQMKGEVSWRKYFQVENGKVNLYKAFLRAVRDKLLESAHPLTVKEWRDLIIRELAQRGEIETAHNYTQYLDELSKNQNNNYRHAWQNNIEKFMAGLNKLEQSGQLTEQNALKLLKPSTSSAPVHTAPLSAQSWYPAEYLGLVPARAETRTASSTPAEGDDFPQIDHPYLNALERTAKAEFFVREGHQILMLLSPDPHNYSGPLFAVLTFGGIRGESQNKAKVWLNVPEQLFEVAEHGPDGKIHPRPNPTLLNIHFGNQVVIKSRNAHDNFSIAFRFSVMPDGAPQVSIESQNPTIIAAADDALKSETMLLADGRVIPVDPNQFQFNHFTLDRIEKTGDYHQKWMRDAQTRTFIYSPAQRNGAPQGRDNRVQNARPTTRFPRNTIRRSEVRTMGLEAEGLETLRQKYPDLITTTIAHNAMISGISFKISKDESAMAQYKRIRWDRLEGTATPDGFTESFIYSIEGKLRGVWVHPKLRQQLGISYFHQFLTQYFQYFPEVTQTHPRLDNYVLMRSLINDFGFAPEDGKVLDIQPVERDKFRVHLYSPELKRLTPEGGVIVQTIDGFAQQGAAVIEGFDNIILSRQSEGERTSRTFKPLDEQLGTISPKRPIRNVLVVTRDKDVDKSIGNMLTHFFNSGLQQFDRPGTVRHVTTSMEAVRALRDSSAPVDLVISQEDMSLWTGSQIAESIRTASRGIISRPDTPVVIFTTDLASIKQTQQQKQMENMIYMEFPLTGMSYDILAPVILKAIAFHQQTLDVILESLFKEPEFPSDLVSQFTQHQKKVVEAAYDHVATGETFTADVISKILADQAGITLDPSQSGQLADALNTALQTATRSEMRSNVLVTPLLLVEGETVQVFEILYKSNGKTIKRAHHLHEEGDYEAVLKLYGAKGVRHDNKALYLDWKASGLENFLNEQKARTEVKVVPVDKEEPAQGDEIKEIPDSEFLAQLHNLENGGIPLPLDNYYLFQMVLQALLANDWERKSNTGLKAGQKPIKLSSDQRDKLVEMKVLTSTDFSAKSAWHVLLPNHAFTIVDSTDLVSILHYLRATGISISKSSRHLVEFSAPGKPDHKLTINLESDKSLQAGLETLITAPKPSPKPAAKLSFANEINALLKSLKKNDAWQNLDPAEFETSVTLELQHTAAGNGKPEKIIFTFKKGAQKLRLTVPASYTAFITALTGIPAENFSTSINQTPAPNYAPAFYALWKSSRSEVRKTADEHLSELQQTGKTRKISLEDMPIIVEKLPHGDFHLEHEIPFISFLASPKILYAFPLLSEMAVIGLGQKEQLKPTLEKLEMILKMINFQGHSDIQMTFESFPGEQKGRMVLTRGVWNTEDFMSHLHRRLPSLVKVLLPMLFDNSLIEINTSFDIAWDQAKGWYSVREYPREEGALLAPPSAPAEFFIPAQEIYQTHADVWQKRIPSSVNLEERPFLKKYLELLSLIGFVPEFQSHLGEYSKKVKEKIDTAAKLEGEAFQKQKEALSIAADEIHRLSKLMEVLYKYSANVKPSLEPQMNALLDGMNWKKDLKAFSPELEEFLEFSSVYKQMGFQLWARMLQIEKQLDTPRSEVRTQQLDLEVSRGVKIGEVSFKILEIDRELIRIEFEAPKYISIGRSGAPPREPSQLSDQVSRLILKFQRGNEVTLKGGSFGANEVSLRVLAFQQAPNLRESRAQIEVTAHEELPVVIEEQDARPRLLVSRYGGSSIIVGDTTVQIYQLIGNYYEEFTWAVSLGVISAGEQMGEFLLKKGHWFRLNNAEFWLSSMSRGMAHIGILAPAALPVYLRQDTDRLPGEPIRPVRSEVRSHTEKKQDGWLGKRFRNTPPPDEYAVRYAEEDPTLNNNPSLGVWTSPEESYSFASLMLIGDREKWEEWLDKLSGVSKKEATLFKQHIFAKFLEAVDLYRQTRPWIGDEFWKQRFDFHEAMTLNGFYNSEEFENLVRSLFVFYDDQQSRVVIRPWSYLIRHHARQSFLSLFDALREDYRKQEVFIPDVTPSWWQRKLSSGWPKFWSILFSLLAARLYKVLGIFIAPFYWLIIFGKTFETISDWIPIIKTLHNLDSSLRWFHYVGFALTSVAFWYFAIKTKNISENFKKKTVQIEMEFLEQRFYQRILGISDDVLAERRNNFKHGFAQMTTKLEEKLSQSGTKWGPKERKMFDVIRDAFLEASRNDASIWYERALAVANQLVDSESKPDPQTVMLAMTREMEEDRPDFWREWLVSHKLPDEVRETLQELTPLVLMLSMRHHRRVKNAEWAEATSSVEAFSQGINQPGASRRRSLISGVKLIGQEIDFNVQSRLLDKGFFEELHKELQDPKMTVEARRRAVQVLYATGIYRLNRVGGELTDRMKKNEAFMATYVNRLLFAARLGLYEFLEKISLDPGFYGVDSSQLMNWQEQTRLAFKKFNRNDFTRPLDNLKKIQTEDSAFRRITAELKPAVDAAISGKETSFVVNTLNAHHDQIMPSYNLIYNSLEGYQTELTPSAIRFHESRLEVSSADATHPDYRYSPHVDMSLLDPSINQHTGKELLALLNPERQNVKVFLANMGQEDSLDFKDYSHEFLFTVLDLKSTAEFFRGKISLEELRSSLENFFRMVKGFPTPPFDAELKKLMNKESELPVQIRAFINRQLTIALEIAPNFKDQDVTDENLKLFEKDFGILLDSRDAYYSYRAKEWKSGMKGLNNSDISLWKTEFLRRQLRRMTWGISILRDPDFFSEFTVDQYPDSAKRAYAKLQKLLRYYLVSLGYSVTEKREAFFPFENAALSAKATKHWRQVRSLIFDLGLMTDFADIVNAADELERLKVSHSTVNGSQRFVEMNALDALLTKDGLNETLRSEVRVGNILQPIRTFLTALEETKIDKSTIQTLSAKQFIMKRPAEMTAEQELKFVETLKTLNLESTHMPGSDQLSFYDPGDLFYAHMLEILRDPEDIVAIYPQETPPPVRYEFHPHSPFPFRSEDTGPEHPRSEVRASEDDSKSAAYTLKKLIEDPLTVSHRNSFVRFLAEELDAALLNQYQAIQEGTQVTLEGLPLAHWQKQLWSHKPSDVIDLLQTETLAQEILTQHLLATHLLSKNGEWQLNQLVHPLHDSILIDLFAKQSEEQEELFAKINEGRTFLGWLRILLTYIFIGMPIGLMIAYVVAYFKGDELIPLMKGTAWTLFISSVPYIGLKLYDRALNRRKERYLEMAPPIATNDLVGYQPIDDVERIAKVIKIDDPNSDVLAEEIITGKDGKETRVVEFNDLPEETDKTIQLMDGQILKNIPAEHLRKLPFTLDEYSAGFLPQSASDEAAGNDQVKSTLNAVKAYIKKLQSHTVTPRQTWDLTNDILEKMENLPAATDLNLNSQAIESLPLFQKAALQRVVAAQWLDVIWNTQRQKEHAEVFSQLRDLALQIPETLKPFFYLLTDKSSGWKEQSEAAIAIAHYQTLAENALKALESFKYLDLIEPSEKTLFSETTTSLRLANKSIEKETRSSFKNLKQVSPETHKKLAGFLFKDVKEFRKLTQQSWDSIFFSVMGDHIAYTSKDAHYIFHMSMHAIRTQVQPPVIKNASAWILETGLNHPDDPRIFRLWNAERYDQYAPLIQRNRAYRHLIFLPDVPPNKKIGVFGTFAVYILVSHAVGFLRSHLPSYIGLAISGIFGIGLLITIAGVFYAPLRHFNALFTFLMIFPHPASYRSAVAAQKIMDQIVPLLKQNGEGKPTVWMDWGALHADIIFYLRHPQLTRWIVKNSPWRHSKTLDHNYIDNFGVISYGDVNFPGAVETGELVNEGLKIYRMGPVSSDNTDGPETSTSSEPRSEARTDLQPEIIQQSARFGPDLTVRDRLVNVINHRHTAESLKFMQLVSINETPANGGSVLVDFTKARTPEEVENLLTTFKVTRNRFVVLNFKLHKNTSALAAGNIFSPKPQPAKKFREQFETIPLPKLTSTEPIELGRNESVELSIQAAKAKTKITFLYFHKHPKFGMQARFRMTAGRSIDVIRSKQYPEKYILLPDTAESSWPFIFDITLGNEFSILDRSNGRVFLVNVLGDLKKSEALLTVLNAYVSATRSEVRNEEISAVKIGPKWKITVGDDVLETEYEESFPESKFPGFVSTLPGFLYKLGVENISKVKSEPALQVMVDDGHSVTLHYLDHPNEMKDKLIRLLSSRSEVRSSIPKKNSSQARAMTQWFFGANKSKPVSETEPIKPLYLEEDLKHFADTAEWVKINLGILDAAGKLKIGAIYAKLESWEAISEGLKISVSRASAIPRNEYSKFILQKVSKNGEFIAARAESKTHFYVYDIEPLEAPRSEARARKRNINDLKAKLEALEKLQKQLMSEVDDHVPGHFRDHYLLRPFKWVFQILGSILSVLAIPFRPLLKLAKEQSEQKPETVSVTPEKAKKQHGKKTAPVEPKKETAEEIALRQAIEQEKREAARKAAIAEALVTFQKELEGGELRKSIPEFLKNAARKNRNISQVSLGIGARIQEILAKVKKPIKDLSAEELAPFYALKDTFVEDAKKQYAPFVAEKYAEEADRRLKAAQKRAAEAAAIREQEERALTIQLEAQEAERQAGILDKLKVQFEDLIITKLPGTIQQDIHQLNFIEQEPNVKKYRAMIDSAALPENVIQKLRRELDSALTNIAFKKWKTLDEQLFSEYMNDLDRGELQAEIKEFGARWKYDSREFWQLAVDILESAESNKEKTRAFRYKRMIFSRVMVKAALEARKAERYEEALQIAEIGLGIQDLYAVVDSTKKQDFSDRWNPFLIAERAQALISLKEYDSAIDALVQIRTLDLDNPVLNTIYNQAIARRSEVRSDEPAAEKSEESEDHEVMLTLNESGSKFSDDQEIAIHLAIRDLHLEKRITEANAEFYQLLDPDSSLRARGIKIFSVDGLEHRAKKVAQERKSPFQEFVIASLESAEGEQKAIYYAKSRMSLVARLDDEKRRVWIEYLNRLMKDEEVTSLDIIPVFEALKALRLSTAKDQLVQLNKKKVEEATAAAMPLAIRIPNMDLPPKDKTYMLALLENGKINDKQLTLAIEEAPSVGKSPGQLVRWSQQHSLSIREAIDLMQISTAKKSAAWHLDKNLKRLFAISHGKDMDDPEIEEMWAHATVWEIRGLLNLVEELMTIARGYVDEYPEMANVASREKLLQLHSLIRDDDFSGIRQILGAIANVQFYSDVSDSQRRSIYTGRYKTVLGLLKERNGLTFDPYEALADSDDRRPDWNEEYDPRSEVRVEENINAEQIPEAVTPANEALETVAGEEATALPEDKAIEPEAAEETESNEPAKKPKEKLKILKPRLLLTVTGDNPYTGVYRAAKDVLQTTQHKNLVAIKRQLQEKVLQSLNLSEFEIYELSESARLAIDPKSKLFKEGVKIYIFKGLNTKIRSLAQSRRIKFYDYVVSLQGAGYTFHPFKNENGHRVKQDETYSILLDDKAYEVIAVLPDPLKEAFINHQLKFFTVTDLDPATTPLDPLLKKTFLEHYNLQLLQNVLPPNFGINLRRKPGVPETEKKFPPFVVSEEGEWKKEFLDKLDALQASDARFGDVLEKINIITTALEETTGTVPARIEISDQYRDPVFFRSETLFIDLSLLLLSNEELKALLNYGINHARQSNLFALDYPVPRELAAYFHYAFDLKAWDQKKALAEALTELQKEGWDPHWHLLYLEAIEKLSSNSPHELMKELKDKITGYYMLFEHILGAAGTVIYGEPTQGQLRKSQYAVPLVAEVSALQALVPHYKFEQLKKILLTQPQIILQARKNGWDELSLHLMFTTFQDLIADIDRKKGEITKSIFAVNYLGKRSTQRGIEDYSEAFLFFRIVYLLVGYEPLHKAIQQLSWEEKRQVFHAFRNALGAEAKEDEIRNFLLWLNGNGEAISEQQALSMVIKVVESIRKAKLPAILLRENRDAGLELQNNLAESIMTRWALWLGTRLRTAEDNSPAVIGLTNYPTLITGVIQKVLIAGVPTDPATLESVLLLAELHKYTANPALTSKARQILTPYLPGISGKPLRDPAAAFAPERAAFRYLTAVKDPEAMNVISQAFATYVVHHPKLVSPGILEYIIKILRAGGKPEAIGDLAMFWLASVSSAPEKRKILSTLIIYFKTYPEATQKAAITAMLSKKENFAEFIKVTTLQAKIFFLSNADPAVIGGNLDKLSNTSIAQDVLTGLNPSLAATITAHRTELKVGKDDFYKKIYFAFLTNPLMPETIQNDEDEFVYNHFRNLGVPINASEATRKKSYKLLSWLFHPDRNPGDEPVKKLFKKIRNANETLNQDAKRVAYVKLLPRVSHLYPSAPWYDEIPPEALAQIEAAIDAKKRPAKEEPRSEVRKIAAALEPGTGFEVSVTSQDMRGILARYKVNQTKLQSQLISEMENISYLSRLSVMNQLDAGISQVTEPEIIIGARFPEGLQGDTQAMQYFLEGYFEGLDSRVREMLLDGRLPMSFQKELAAKNIEPRMGLNIARAMTLKHSVKNSVPVALFTEQGNSKINAMYTPVFINDIARLVTKLKNDPDATDKLRWLGKLTSRTEIHLADLARTGQDAEKLKGELLKRLGLEGYDLVSIGKIGTNQGFAINAVLAEKIYTDLRAKAMLEISA